MTKSSFVVKTDADTGIQYIMKNEDALTKNHRTDKENFTGFMPEERGSIYCPVASYEKYVSKRKTKCDRLWQYPRDTYCEQDNEWFCNKPVGRDALAAYDKAIKKNVDFHKTIPTILSRQHFSNSPIMAVTGHKSVISCCMSTCIKSGKTSNGTCSIRWCISNCIRCRDNGLLCRQPRLLILFWLCPHQRHHIRCWLCHHQKYDVLC